MNHQVLLTWCSGERCGSWAPCLLNNSTYYLTGVPGVRIFVDSSVCFGSETIIKSEVSSIPTADKFEWQKSKDGDDFYCIGKQEDFGNTDNFTCPILTIPKATFADKLHYRLLVWNRIGESFSNTIFLNVTGSMTWFLRLSNILNYTHFLQILISKYSVFHLWMQKITFIKVVIYLCRSSKYHDKSGNKHQKQISKIDWQRV